VNEPDSVETKYLSAEEANALLSHIGRLKEDNPVRLAALAVLRGDTPPSVHPLTESLLARTAKRWRERKVAAWTLGRARLNRDETDNAAGLLSDVLENAHQDSKTKWLVRGILRSLGISTGLGFLSAILFPHWGHDTLYSTAFYATIYEILFGWIMVLFSLYLESNAHARVRAQAAASLANLNVIDSIGPLAHHLFDRDKQTSEACLASLHHLLPLVREEHYGVLGAGSITTLAHALRHPDGNLVLKLLDALDKIGTSHAIPFVAQVASKERTRLRDAALRTLETLKARQQREDQRNTLLRPTTSPTDPASILLRPAGSVEASGAQDANLLLRPVSDD
jgi:HEAT repeat protein